MTKRLKRLFTITAALMLLTTTFALQGKIKLDTEKQCRNYVRKGKTLTEQMNRLGKVFARDLGKMVDYIVDQEKWKEYGYKKEKMYLVFSYNRIKKDKAVYYSNFFDTGEWGMNSLRIQVYDMLGTAIENAVFNDKKLKRYIEPLTLDKQMLENAVAESGDPMRDPNTKLDTSKIKSMNTNYCFSLAVLRKSKKIILSGRAYVLATGNKIATTTNFEIEAEELFDKYFPSPPPIREINRQNVDVNPLNVSIKCKRKGSDKIHAVAAGDVFYEGDTIWLDLTLPRLGGYLLVYAGDSHHRLFNLFPGTKQAVTEGNYRVPYSLKNYTTDVLGTVHDQADEVAHNQIRLGGYELDEKTGDETVYFYYSNERNAKLEEFLVKHAVEVGINIKSRGFKKKVTKFNPADYDASIDTPLLHYKKARLILKHVKR